MVVYGLYKFYIEETASEFFFSNRKAETEKLQVSKFCIMDGGGESVAYPSSLTLFHPCFGKGKKSPSMTEICVQAQSLANLV